MKKFTGSKKIFYIPSKGEKKLYAVLYLPDSTGKLPLFILCHGFGSSSRLLHHYGEQLMEEGIACLLFDFYGGGDYSKSGGSMLEMTVLDQVGQLKDVLLYASELAQIDPARIYAGGESQGGLVCSLCACEEAERLKGLVLLYTATYIPDFLRKKYPDLNKLHDEERLLGFQINKKYIEEIYDLDPYPMLADYPGQVLILHGTKDQLVPMEVAEKTRDSYQNARLLKLEGAKHGIYGGAYLKIVMEEIIKFIEMDPA